MGIIKNNLEIKDLLPLIIVLFLFWIKGTIFIDPDFGWRLKAGEIYLNQEIPKTDPFSYTMSSFPWVDHAWLQSLFFYLIYSKLGYKWLAFFYALLVVLTLLISFFATKKFLLDKIKPLVLEGKEFYNPLFKSLGILLNFPLSLLISVFFSFFGIRVQVLSWLLISVLIFILLERKMWEKTKFLLPIFFLIWANLHGSFLLGNLTLWLFIVLKSIRERKIKPIDYGLAFLSTLVCFVNPYGSGIWREVFSTIFDTRLRFKIAEWMPVITMPNLAMISLIGLSLGLFITYRNKFFLEEKVIFLIFLFQTIVSRRQLPIWAVVSQRVSNEGLSFLWIDAKSKRYGVKRFEIFYKVIVIFSLLVAFLQVLIDFEEAKYLSFEGGFYPVKAVEFLNASKMEGEVFSEYGWGGYLIWKLDKRKVFVDGRMPSWRNSSALPNELESSFDTYNDILSGNVDYKDVFEKFNIKIVLWSRPRSFPLNNFFEKVEDYLSRFGWRKSRFDFLEILKMDGWQEIYEDDTAVIYRLPI